VALDREQVGLAFKIDTDSRAAKEELEAFREFIAGIIEGVEAEFREQSKKLEEYYRKRAEAAEGSNKRIGGSERALHEVREELLSELLELIVRDGTLANSLSSSLLKVGNSAVLMSAGVVGAVAAIGAGFVAAANHAAELGDQIDELSKQTGLTAETLSGLGTAAKLEGKSLGDLSGTLSGFSQKLIDARAGNNELQAAFRALGVDIKGTADQALRQAVSRLAEFKDGAEKWRLRPRSASRTFFPSSPIWKAGLTARSKRQKSLDSFSTRKGRERRQITRTRSHYLDGNLKD
jgi:hypothetical protein